MITHSRTVFRVGLLMLGLLAILVIHRAGVVRAAPPTDLFISEYIEGSSNNKAIEIYNGTGASIDLSTGTYNVQVFSNGSGTAGTTVNLTGTVANGDVFVLAHSTAAAEILAQADQTSSAGLWNGDDAIVLRKGTTVIDSFGVVGTDPGTEWGTGLTSTADNTLQRKDTICAGDIITNDTFDPATEWNGFANDTFTGLGSHTANCTGPVTPSLSINDVSLNEGNAGTTSFDFTVRLSLPAGAGGVTFDIATANGTAVAPVDYAPNSLTSQTIAAGNTTYTFSVLVNGDTTAESNETFFVNVTNVVGATVGDAQGQGTIITDDATISRIHDVQGNGAASPIVGSLVTIEGIVVGDFQDTTADPPNELNGYFVQEEDVDIDADPNTSEGVFVFEGANPSTPAVALGDKVRVTGTVEEFGDAPDTYTEIVGPLTVVVLSSGNPLPTPASIDLPVSSLSDYEKYESMSVAFVDELTVTEVFTLSRYGEVLLAAGGRLDIPTTAAEPGASALAVRDANTLRSILLDDGLTNQNPATVRYPEPGGLSATNTLRGGDTTTGLTGVLHYLDTTEDFRVQPVGAITWDHENPRPADAPVISGSLKVVGANVLNYFTTVDPGPDICGPAGNMDCRGADSAQEFTRQRDKILNALAEMDADIYGFNELENNADADPANDGTDPVLEDIVDGLNAIVGANTYAFIDAGVVGSDAIKVSLIYKPASVTPVGDFAILDSSYDPDFIDTRNRPVLAQTFEDNNGGVFTVAVTHLKSKGSACTPDDPDTGDLSGNCNLTRTKAAEVMVDWFASDPTNSGDSDILLIGDLNSYANEDPIDVFVAAGYVDLAADKIADPYSYVFDGEWGYLDYAFASPTLYPQVTGAAEWHINADEPIALDYNTEFKTAGQISGFYSPLPFRVSDHDPMMVGLTLTSPDTTDPNVTINQAGGQSDPTSSSPINFTVVFSEPVTGFVDADVTLGGTAGATTAVVTEVAPMDDTTYNVAVSGMTGNGTVTASIGIDKAEDAAGNGNTASTSTDNEVTYVAPDTTDPNVTINQAGGQSDPTSSSPINFTVVFSEPVTGFVDADVTLGGTAGATTAVVTEVAPMDDTTYNVAVSGMTGNGTVTASIGIDKAEDAAGNGNTASTSTDNTVDYAVPVATASLFISTKVAGTVGATPYGSEDILKWDGSAWTVWFDGSATGLVAKNARHNINAFWIPDADGDDVIISFAQNSRVVPGIGPKVDGMDLVKWDGSTYSLYFDGSDVGLTVKTQEKIDGLHIMPTNYPSPLPMSCPAGYLLISTQGPGKVTAFDGSQLKFGGEDILGFCATNLGSATAGWWHMVFDGSAAGLPKNAIDSISANADGSVISFTTPKAINVPGAVGGHSMVFEYDMISGAFSGPVFSAPAVGINKQVDGLYIAGDLP